MVLFFLAMALSIGTKSFWNWLRPSPFNSPAGGPLPFFFFTSLPGQLSAIFWHRVNLESKISSFIWWDTLKAISPFLRVGSVPSLIYLQLLSSAHSRRSMDFGRQTGWESEQWPGGQLQVGRPWPGLVTDVNPKNHFGLRDWARHRQKSFSWRAAWCKRKKRKWMLKWDVSGLNSGFAPGYLSVLGQVALPLKP